MYSGDSEDHHWRDERTNYRVTTGLTVFLTGTVFIIAAVIGLVFGVLAGWFMVMLGVG